MPDVKQTYVIIPANQKEGLTRLRYCLNHASLLLDVAASQCRSDLIDDMDAAEAVAAAAKIRTFRSLVSSEAAPWNPATPAPAACDPDPIRRGLAKTGATIGTLIGELDPLPGVPGATRAKLEGREA